MSGVKEFFTCCGAWSSDPEIIVNMQKKRRSISCKTPDKRVFIKRSVGKNPILDLSIKNTNKSTENTPKANSSLNIKGICDLSDITLHQSSFDESFQIGQKNAGLSKNCQQCAEKRQKNKQFINYHDYNKSILGNFTLPNLNEKTFQLQEPQHLRVINQGDRRIITHKQANPHYLLDFQNRNLIKTMGTILEVIDERSSIPSMEGSQLHEMRQISSKATIKSNIYDKNESKNMSSPLTDKYDSLIMKDNHYKQPLRMANSLSLLNSQRKTSQQINLISVSKLEMENRIIQKELNALREEENFLRQQKDYDHKRFIEEHEKIVKIRQQYSQKLAQRQIQLSQIKQIMSKRGQQLNK